jgi:dTDP-4-amino-4,6-dideoxygalactose transaminase
LLMRDLSERSAFIKTMNQLGFNCVFHYVPLHSSPLGLRHGRVCGNMSITNQNASRLVRLPLWVGLEMDNQQLIINEVLDWLRTN